MFVGAHDWTPAVHSLNTRDENFTDDYSNILVMGNNMQMFYLDEKSA